MISSIIKLLLHYYQKLTGLCDSTKTYNRDDGVDFNNDSSMSSLRYTVLMFFLFWVLSATYYRPSNWTGPFLSDLELPCFYGLVSFELCAVIFCCSKMLWYSLSAGGLTTVLISTVSIK